MATSGIDWALRERRYDSQDGLRVFRQAGKPRPRWSLCYVAEGGGEDDEALWKAMEGSVISYSAALGKRGLVNSRYATQRTVRYYGHLDSGVVGTYR